MNWTFRLAQDSDIPALEQLIPLSVRALQSPYYSPAQMEAALGPVFGVDRQLIADKTYFVVEHQNLIIGCGGWSKRKSLFGSDHGRNEIQNSELNPTTDPARIRAFFVHPDWARQGIGRAILLACEEAIAKAGFKRIELVATLAGEPLYAKHGYAILEHLEIPLPQNLTLSSLRMGKTIR